MNNTDEYGLTAEQKEDWRYAMNLRPHSSSAACAIGVAEGLVAVLAELMEARSRLRAAASMANVVDDWVERRLIDSRSALADARLAYGYPFKHESERLEDDWRKAAEEWMRKKTTWPEKVERK